jgi:hypothetical protein
LRNHGKKISYRFPSLFMFFLVITPAFLMFLFQYVPVYAASISGETKTILRMGKTADDRSIYPLYEYLSLGIVNETGGGSISGNLGGWGRIDLRDRRSDRYTNADLQYGYASYQGNQNNLLLNAGRQFVAEGVATERVDGVHLRGDLAAGFGVAAFVGAPVVVETDFTGGDVVYGGRVTHSVPQYYTIGLSALRTDYNSSRIREESGIDLWFHPIKQVDVVGRSTYNSITSGWMEHAYMATFSPLQNLRFTADLSNISYKDYFYQMTTKAFSLTRGLLDPNEKVFALGGGVDYTPVENVNLSADYKNYAYDIAGPANYYGGKATFTLPESFMAGLAIHRMDGENAKLRYMEYRLFATKKLGKVDLTADLFDVDYDSPINGVKQTYSASVAAAYAITDRIKLSADVDYSRNPDFDGVLSGMVRFTYAFDKQFGTEGRAKSEKK